jgi:hypothetical protein
MKMKLELRCVVHPKYTGKQEPSVYCLSCEWIYREKKKRDKRDYIRHCGSYLIYLSELLKER